MNNYKNKNDIKVNKIDVAIGVVIFIILSALTFQKENYKATLGCFVIAIILILYLLYPFVKKSYKRKVYLTSGMSEVDKMTGAEFEEFLEAHYTSLGYKVKHTGKSGDQGADLILTRNNERIVVQAKRYKKNVSNSAIQQTLAATVYYKADRGIVVTNAHFTKSAIDLANRCGIELKDRDFVKRLAKRYKN